MRFEICRAALKIFLAGILLSGCAGIPFEPVRFSPVEGINPGIVRKDFEGRLAGKFEVLESAVVRYRYREFAALGYTEVDSQENSLGVAGFTPMGVKIFEIKSAGEKFEYAFSFPQIEKKIDPGKFAHGMAEDVRRIYLGRVPQASAEVVKAKDRIYYRQASGKGALEFVFGGPEMALVEKRYREGRRELWRVRYFEYRAKGSKIYPSKIFFENRVRKYSLALRLKEILA